MKLFKTSLLALGAIALMNCSDDAAATSTNTNPTTEVDLEKDGEQTITKDGKEITVTVEDGKIVSAEDEDGNKVEPEDITEGTSSDEETSSESKDDESSSESETSTDSEGTSSATDASSESETATPGEARVLDDMSKNADGREGGSNHDNTGLWGAGDDVLKGGTAQVLSGDGANNLRGSCSTDVDGCLYDGWKFFDQAGGAFDGTSLNVLFNITDWTPNTVNGAEGATGWGAGADAVLSYFWKTGAPDKDGTPKEFAPISKSDVLCVDMEYTDDGRGTSGNPDLRIALREDKFDWDGDKGRPFYSQDGIRSGLKGILGAARKTWKLPIENFRRPKWISDAGTATPIRYTIEGFDIIRLESPFEEAEAKAPAAFPTAKSGKTKLKIYKISLNDC